MQLLGHMAVLLLVKNGFTIFTLTTHVPGSQSPQGLASIRYFLFCAQQPSEGCSAVSPCSCECVSLMCSDAELLLWSYSLFTYLFGEVSLQVLCPFINQVVFIALAEF